VQQIWRAQGLRPHLVRRFKLSNDPQFAAKLQEMSLAAFCPNNFSQKCK
jgi:hypothetical protein